MHLIWLRKLDILKGYYHCSHGIYNLGIEKTMNGTFSELRILVQSVTFFKILSYLLRLSKSWQHFWKTESQKFYILIAI